MSEMVRAGNFYPINIATGSLISPLQNQSMENFYENEYENMSDLNMHNK